MTRPAGRPGRERSQRRWQWALLLLAAVLLTALLRAWQQERPSPPSASPHLLAPREEAAVTAIEILRPGARMRVERRGESWRMVAPLDDLASSRMVRELFRALGGIEVLRRLESDSLARYALDPPWARLVLEMGDTTRAELLVGATAPASGQVYAAWAGLEGVAIIPRFLVEQFVKSDLYHWREREILPPSRAPIDSIRVERQGERVRAVRRSPEEWSFTEPADREADPLSCERAVAAFWRFSFDEFFDEPGAAARLGLARPAAVWTVFRGGRADTLRIGGRLEGQGLAVQLAGRPPGLMRADLYELLAGGVSALEVRRPLRGDPRAVDRLVLAGAAGGRLLVRRAGGWFGAALAGDELAACEAGNAPAVDEERLARVADPAVEQDLRNLFELRGERWIDRLADDPRPADYDLRLHLWSREGEHAWVFFRREPSCRAAPEGPGARAAAFSGSTVGSRFPRRPLCVSSDLVWRWQVRSGRDS